MAAVPESPTPAAPQAALRFTARVLPGHRLNVASPELPEGVEVEMIVLLPGKATTAHEDFLDLITSSVTPTRTEEDWRERELREQRESWDP